MKRKRSDTGPSHSIKRFFQAASVREELLTSISEPSSQSSVNSNDSQDSANSEDSQDVVDREEAQDRQDAVDREEFAQDRQEAEDRRDVEDSDDAFETSYTFNELEATLVADSDPVLEPVSTTGYDTDHQSKTLIRDLERQKTNLKFDIGLTEAAELLEWEGEIEFELEQLKVDSRKPKITKESLKSEFYSIIDKLIEELKLRFGDEQLLIYKAFFELLDIKDDVSDDKFESTFELFKIEDYISQKKAIAELRNLQSCFPVELDK
jgi:hypothetical protein